MFSAKPSSYGRVQHPTTVRSTPLVPFCNTSPTRVPFRLNVHLVRGIITAPSLFFSTGFPDHLLKMSRAEGPHRPPRRGLCGAERVDRPRAQSVFKLKLQSPMSTKNDSCRLFIREDLLDLLSSALVNVMANRGEAVADMKRKITQILLVFCQVSQPDVHARNALGTRKVVRRTSSYRNAIEPGIKLTTCRVLRACKLLEPEYLVHMLKAIKHLSMNAMLLEVPQNANAIEILTRILDEQSSGPHSTEMSNHVFQTCYNLC